MGGSTNWTNPGNLFNDYNNIIFIHETSITEPLITRTNFPCAKGGF